MKLGLNLLLWTSFVDEAHLPLCGDLRALGYDGVELPMGAGDEAHYGRLGRQLGELGLGVTTCLGLGPEEDPASSDPAVRAAAVERLRAVVRMSAAAGSEVLCGPLHSAWKVFRGRGPTEDELGWSAETLRAAAEEAETCGLRLAIEPLNRFEAYVCTTVDGANELVRRVDHPALGLHYDTHHMHLEERDVTDALRRAAPSMGHVHISENDRGTPGTGQVRWEATFAGLRDAGYDGWLTIEAFSRLDPEFAAAIHIWRDTCSDPMDLARDGLSFLQHSIGSPTS